MEDAKVQDCRKNDPYRVVELLSLKPLHPEENTGGEYPPEMAAVEAESNNTHILQPTTTTTTTTTPVTKTATTMAQSTPRTQSPPELGHEKKIQYVYANSPPGRNSPSPSMSSISSYSSASSSLCCLFRLNRLFRRFVRRHRTVFLKAFLALLFVGYLAFVGYCMYYSFGDEPSVRLLVLTVIVVLVVAYKVGARSCRSASPGRFFSDRYAGGMMLRKIVRRALYVLSVAGAVAVVIIEVILKRPENLVSLAGLAFLIIFCLLISSKPEKINWHAVFWGMMLQFWFAVLIRKTSFGSDAFEWLSDRFVEFLRHTDKGSIAVFGQNYLDHRFVFALMPTLIFFNAMISMFYYMRLVQVFIATFGKFLSFCIGTSPIESVNAAANLFLTLSEAPILIKPFMKDITKSELFAVMTGGFASIAGSLLWAFAAYGAPIEHILTASVMSAPAALAFAKLIYPDERKPTVKAEDAYDVDVSHHGSLLGALSNGAKDGLTMAGYVVINILIYVALLAFLDQTLLWFTARAGMEGLTFSKLIAYIFYPVTYMMGFPAEDCFKAARLLGIKVLTTTTVNTFRKDTSNTIKIYISDTKEIVTRYAESRMSSHQQKRMCKMRMTNLTFMELGIIITNGETLQNYIDTYNGTWSYVGDDIFLEATNTTLVGGVLSERSGILATYMICGLSNLGSIGIAVGAFSAIAPTRTNDVIKTVPLALLAGNLACISTACVAGLLETDLT